MRSKQGSYALLQYSPIPERLEFVNVGVVLFVPEESYVGVRYSRGLKRVERLYGKQPSGYFNTIKEAFASRLRLDFSGKIDAEKLQNFASSRANNLRMTRILSVAFDNAAEKELNTLFDVLVGEEFVRSRSPKLASELKRKFEQAGVASYVQKPAVVRLPEGIEIDVPYGYQNGSLNLISPIRLSGDPEFALANASRQAIEGQWLKRHSVGSSEPKQLVVVGDFSDQKPAFISAVEDMMVQHDVKLYDWDNVEPLIADIREHGSSIPPVPTA